MDLTTHILRPALPWHGPDDEVTLCGRDRAPGVLIRRERPGRGDRRDPEGCAVCWSRVDLAPSWMDDPLKVLERWMGDFGLMRRRRLVRQLRALGRETPDDAAFRHEREAAWVVDEVTRAAAVAPRSGGFRP